MAFSSSCTVRALTKAGIEVITPGQNGVYGLFRENRWVYVGRGDIRARLLDHLGGGNPCIAREVPTHWVAEVTTNDVAREKELILELQPACNQKVG